MTYEEEYDHFHIVGICVECADIEVLGVARNQDALSTFYDTIADQLVTTAGVLGDSIKFVVKIVSPNKIVTITPENGHDMAHVVVAVTHKCKDSYDSCYEYTKLASLKRMVKLVSSSFMTSGGTRRTPKEPKVTDNSQRLLESLDLPEDLFKGMS